MNRPAESTSVWVGHPFNQACVGGVAERAGLREHAAQQDPDERGRLEATRNDDSLHDRRRGGLQYLGHAVGREVLLDALALDLRELAHDLFRRVVQEHGDGQERVIDIGHGSLIALRHGGRLRLRQWETGVLVGSGVGLGAGVLVGSGVAVGGGCVGIGVLVVTREGDDSEPEGPQAMVIASRPTATSRTVRELSKM